MRRVMWHAACGVACDHVIMSRSPCRIFFPFPLFFLILIVKYHNSVYVYSACHTRALSHASKVLSVIEAISRVREAAPGSGRQVRGESQRPRSCHVARDARDLEISTLRTPRSRGLGGAAIDEAAPGEEGRQGGEQAMGTSGRLAAAIDGVGGGWATGGAGVGNGGAHGVDLWCGIPPSSVVLASE